MDQKAELTAIITQRLKEYMEKTTDQGSSFYQEYIPEFVDAALNYQFFRDNPDILPTIFIHETSAGRNITRPGNAINYGVADPKMSAKFAARDIITNLRASIEEIAQSGSVYAPWRTGKPLTESELRSFAAKYEPANPNYPDYLVGGREEFNRIQEAVRTGVLQPSVTPSPSPTSMPTPTPVVPGTTPSVLGITQTRQAQPTKAPQEKKYGVVEQIKSIPGYVKEVARPTTEYLGDLYKSATSPISGFLPGDATITGAFGARNAQYWGNASHEGTDFRAAERTPISMPMGWQVVKIQRDDVGTYGRNVTLMNPKTGERIQFAHLNDVNNMLVPGGFIDSKEKQIVGMTGKSGTGLGGQKFAAHLHVNYWDEKGKMKDVTKVMRNFINEEANKAISSINPVKPAYAAERNFSTTIVPTPSTILSRNQISSPIKPLQSPTTPSTRYQVQPIINNQPKSNLQLIKQGDNLSTIAKSYNTSLQNLMNMNPQIKNANKIYTGDVLNVPAPRVQPIASPVRKPAPSSPVKKAAAPYSPIKKAAPSSPIRSGAISSPIRR